MSQDILNDHERRISIMESQYEHLVPRLEVMEIIAPLRQQVNTVQGTLETFARTTETQIGRLTNELGEGMKRLSAINEETMKSAARQKEETHQKDLQLRDAQIAEMKQRELELKQQAEARRLVNRIKNEYAPLGTFVITLWALLQYGGMVLSWLIKILT